MYKFEKKLDIGAYSWGADFSVRVVFHPLKYGCKGVGSVAIRLIWQLPEYSGLYKFTPIYSDNYKMLKFAVEQFIGLYGGRFNLEDEQKFYNLMAEAFGYIVLKMNKKELEF